MEIPTDNKKRPTPRQGTASNAPKKPRSAVLPSDSPSSSSSAPVPRASESSQAQLAAFAPQEVVVHEHSKTEEEKRSDVVVAKRPLAVVPPIAELAFADNTPFKISSIFGTFDTNCTLDMRQLVTRAKNVEYNSKKYPSACFFKLRNPQLTGVVYVHGRVNVLGGKDLAQTRFAGKKLARLLQRCGYPDVKFLNWRIETMSASVDLGHPIRLSALAAHHKKATTYEPEISPSLFYRAPDKVQCTIQCWASGKVMLTGAKELDDFHRAYELIRPIATPFQM